MSHRLLFSPLLALIPFINSAQARSITSTNPITPNTAHHDGLAAELDSSGNLLRKYLFAPEGSWGTSPLAIEEGGNYYYYHNDQIGTPQAITTGIGTKVWEARYSPYGAANVLQSGVNNPLRFPGQYSDPESGLHYNFQRNYDPALGGYLEQDPYGVSITGANRYRYANDNPVSFYDPTGELPAILVPAAGVIFIAGAIYSGFLALDCIVQSIDDECTFGQTFANCWKSVFSAVLSFGIGKAIPILQPVITGARAVVGIEEVVGELVASGAGEAEAVAKLLPSPRDHFLSFVKDSKLRRRIEQLYRRNARIGSGSTADAIRHERITGKPLGSKTGHTTKGIENRTGLLKDIRSGRLNFSDKQIAKEILKDIQDALSGL